MVPWPWVALLGGSVIVRIFTMTGVNASLAALVTQAPPLPQEQSIPLSTPGARPGSTAATLVCRALCRCRHRRQEPFAKKLAAVVPETSTAPPVVYENTPVSGFLPAPASGASSPVAKAASSSVQDTYCQPVCSHRREPPQLPQQSGRDAGRKTLVLDLDETLVHSSFRIVPDADIIIKVEIDGDIHHVYVRKRPGCDEFLASVADLYEVVIYTASMSKYASPLIDQLDKDNWCSYRLYREACTRLAKGYVKDLSRLGRHLKDVIIIDNSPTCYALQPDNAIPIRGWRDDLDDRELLDLIPILRSLADVEDIPQVLKHIVWADDEGEGADAPGREWKRAAE